MQQEISKNAMKDVFTLNLTVQLELYILLFLISCIMIFSDSESNFYHPNCMYYVAVWDKYFEKFKKSLDL